MGAVSKEAKAAKAARQIRYNKAHTTQVTLRLNLTTEADIVERLKSQGNKQGYIKRLIREDMARDSPGE